MRNVFDYHDNGTYLSHHGILGMKWGIRRFQHKDGTLTEAGKERYRSAYDVSVEVNEKIKPNLLKVDDIEDASQRFNELGDELASDYQNYYNSLKNNKKFKTSIFERMHANFGVGVDDDELFDFYKDEVAEEVLSAYQPKVLTDKVKKFYEAGDLYFERLESLADPIIKEYKDQGIEGVTKKYAHSTEPIAVYVKDLLSANVQWNSYMYRHFDDYWVNDVDSRYELLDSITADDYNKWAKSKGV